MNDYNRFEDGGNTQAEHYIAAYAPLKQNQPTYVWLTSQTKIETV